MKNSDTETERETREATNRVKLLCQQRNRMDALERKVDDLKNRARSGEGRKIPVTIKLPSLFFDEGSEPRWPFEEWLSGFMRFMRMASLMEAEEDVKVDYILTYLGVQAELILYSYGLK